MKYERLDLKLFYSFIFMAYKNTFDLLKEIRNLDKQFIFLFFC